MKVITAPESYTVQDGDVCCFLAGGITNCWDWQKHVIDKLSQYSDTEHLVLINPRRESFDINDPTASDKQVEWEFNWLEKMDIFSMYFADSESVQPICMYELGRNLLRMQMRFPTKWQNRLVISSEFGYKRKFDVMKQTNLATLGNIVHAYNEDNVECAEVHAREIYFAYNKILKYGV